MQLSIKQTQELQIVMSTQLRQAIELLQYSTQELEQYIREQELVNPLIELSEPTLKEHLQIPKTSSGHYNNWHLSTKCEKIFVMSCSSRSG